jgi:hypothetical protein
MFKYEKGELSLIYKFVKQPVSTRRVYGRSGYDSPSLVVYTLESGRRILPAHFKYGLVQIPGDFFAWKLAANYPGSVLRSLMHTENPFLKMIPKAPAWQGGFLPITIK